MHHVYHEKHFIDILQTFGTPLEDALRRDITINSLFYNVHSRSVEDFTGKVHIVFTHLDARLPDPSIPKQGLDDLKAGIIRTPLPPRETFMDDPLRVLRCIRFASRYGFEIDEGVSKAIHDPDIQVRTF